MENLDVRRDGEDLQPVSVCDTLRNGVQVESLGKRTYKGAYGYCWVLKGSRARGPEL